MGRGTLTLHLCAADSRTRMRGRLAEARAAVASAGDAPLPDVLGCQARGVPEAASLNAAFVARDAREALAALATVERWLALHDGPPVHAARGVVLVTGSTPRVGLLLPGQGVPAPGGLGALGVAFPEVAGVHAAARIPRDGTGDVPASSIQLAIVAASLSALDVVRRLDVAPAFALGHSLGELTALAWAGAFDDEVVLELARARGQAMVNGARAPGAMAAVAAEPKRLAELLRGSQLTVACFNAPERHVVAGAPGEIDALLARADARGVIATRLDVTGAFHTPLMRDAAAAFDLALANVPRRSMKAPMLSCVTGTWIAPDVDVRAHLRAQMLAPVRFLDAALVAARNADVLIEAGPGRALGALMAEIAPTIPVISPGVGERSPRRVLELVASTWACGFTSAPAVAACVRSLDAHSEASRSRRSNAATTSS